MGFNALRHLRESCPGGNERIQIHHCVCLGFVTKRGGKKKEKKLLLLKEPLFEFHCFCLLNDGAE